MATGRILQFDEMRAFGFIAADDNGEDVFLHASVYDGDPNDLAPGTRVEFQVMEGGRGRKAFAVRLLDDGAEEPVGGADHGVPSVAAPRDTSERADDLLSEVEFARATTELLLEAAPSLTGGQLVQVRQGMIELARKHNWIYT